MRSSTGSSSKWFIKGTAKKKASDGPVSFRGNRMTSQTTLTVERITADNTDDREENY